MALQSECQRALELVEELQAKLEANGDSSHDQELTQLMWMLDSPLFTKLLNIQDSINQLKQVTQAQAVTPEDFDITPTGEVVFSESVDQSVISPEGVMLGWEGRTDSSPTSSLPFSTHTYNIEFKRSLEKLAQGRDVETIVLNKAENVSLGFSVVGLKSEHRGELGIFVQEIQPTGIAARDGRLREGDQILALDGQVLDGSISHQQAIRLLQKASGPVELVLARGGTHPASSPEHSRGTSGDSNEMVLSTEWSQVEVVDLMNDGTGLGFGIIGGRSTGVVVKTIVEGGVAYRDGRLQSGDHVLQINDVNVRGMGSDQVASVLRQSSNHVRLIIARCVPDPQQPPNPQLPVLPTHMIDEQLHRINAVLANEAQTSSMAMANGDIIHNVDVHHEVGSPMSDVSDVDVFSVELEKGTQGLGITIAGYVGEKNAEELSGIFVKSISEGSAAAMDQRIQVNDQIVEVDGLSLQGYTNHQAVEVLKNTGQTVCLKLARYKHGPKLDQLKQYAGGYTGEVDIGQITTDFTKPSNVDNVNLFSDGMDYIGELKPEEEAELIAKWQPIVGDQFQVVVAQLTKFKEGGGLGISLEGTVDVENGVEVRPHHYIRSVLKDGPVGINGKLESSDELLEVNGKRLLGLNHVEVVRILKELPQHVRIVCARRIAQSHFHYAQTSSDKLFQTSQAPSVFSSSATGTNVTSSLPESQMAPPAAMGGATISDRLVKAKSEQSLMTTTAGADTGQLSKGKSRSLEPLTKLAMWSDEPVEIKLHKGERGLGFSILDYEDPMNPSQTVIVIRSLVPGGVAQMDGHLVPGDRLMFVNDTHLENATLDEAVQALKGAGKGIVRIGVVKPLPLPEIGESSTDDMDLPPSHPPPPVPDSLPPEDTPVGAPPLLAATKLSEIRVTAKPTSDLSKPCSASSTPSISSPLSQGSPIASPLRSRGFNVTLPVSLEKTIKIKKGHDQLGVTVEAIDQGVNGCVVRSITDGAISKDGRIAVGDYIITVNNESMRNISNAQARAILRRASLLGVDISITYIPGADADVHRQTAVYVTKEEGSPTSQLSPKAGLTQSTVAAASPANQADRARSVAASVPTQENQAALQGRPDEAQPAIASVWSEPRLVEVHRKEGESLGISIVGGRVDLTASPENSISGIFIKHVLDNSPAGRVGQLRTGDRILEVDGVDLRDASHDQAVAVIKKSTTPVLFLVQSLSTAEAGAEPSPAVPALSAAVPPRLGSARSRIVSDHLTSDEEDEFGCSLNKLLKTYGDLNGQLHLVEFERGSNGLGISLAGNRDLGTMSVFVVGISPDSPTAKDGRIHIGDQLLEINGQVLYGRSHLNASAIIKSVTSRKVKIVLLRRGDYLEHMAVKPLKQPKVVEKNDPQTLLSRPAKPADSQTSTKPPVPIKPPQLSANNAKTVVLQKGSTGLGFAIQEGNHEGTPAIYVRTVSPGGPAAESGQLEVGDQLVAVDGQNLIGVSYDKAIDLLRGTQGSVTLKVIKAKQPASLILAEPPVPLPAPAAEKAAAATEKVPTAAVEKTAVTTAVNVPKQNVVPAQPAPAPAPVARETEVQGEPDEVPAAETRELPQTHPNSIPPLSDHPASTPDQQMALPLSPISIVESPPAEEADPLTCPIMPGRDTHILIQKGRSGLGLSIVGGSDTLLGAIIIHEVYDDGAAAKDGRLWAGDHILEVNGEDLRDASHERAIQVLRQTPADVDMIVLREEAQLKDEDIYDIITVDLVKKPGRGLGLSIVGRKNDVGVFISDIVKGGTAEADGQLMQGDQILEVNGENLREATQDDAAAILKTVRGKVTLVVGRLKGSRSSSRRTSSSSDRGLKKSDSNASNRSKGRFGKGLPMSPSY